MRTRTLLSALLMALLYITVASAQYPVMDAIANKVIAKLRTPVRAPKANAYCERLIGTMRREFLDFVIPLGERHLRGLLKEWVAHYNQSRPHSSLGPGIPEPSNLLPPLPSSGRHTLLESSRVMARPMLGGLHHEYRLEKVAA